MFTPSTPVSTPVSTPKPATTLKAALESLDLQIVRIREWIRLYGDHDSVGQAGCAANDLVMLARLLKNQAAQQEALFGTGALPLVRTGPGGDFCQDAHVGSLLDIRG